MRMAFNFPLTSDPPHREGSIYFRSDSLQLRLDDGTSYYNISKDQVFSKGRVILTPVPQTIVIWRAPFPCSITAVTGTSETLNVTFYYSSLPAKVVIAEPANTSISTSSYYTAYSAWLVAAAPAVYNDAGSDYLMVKSTYSTPVMLIVQAIETTTSSSFSTSGSTTTTASVTSKASTYSTSTVSTIGSPGSNSLFAPVLAISAVIGVALAVEVARVSCKRPPRRNLESKG